MSLLPRPKLIYGFLVHLPFYILNLPTIFPLFLAGHFLYCAKLIPLSNVSNVWLRFYTGMCLDASLLQLNWTFRNFHSGRRDHDSRSSIIVNLLQESIFEEIVTESMPQLIIQAVNQTLNQEWTTLGFASMFMSATRFAPAHRLLFIARYLPAILCVTFYSGHQPWR